MSVFGSFMAGQAAKQDSEILELRTERDKLKAQRDALLAALRRISERDPQSPVCGDKSPRYCTFDCEGCIARAAIEEAEK